jgi:hypothetical protein
MNKHTARYRDHESYLMLQHSTEQTADPGMKTHHSGECYFVANVQKGRRLIIIGEFDATGHMPSKYQPDEFYGANPSVAAKTPRC